MCIRCNMATRGGGICAISEGNPLREGVLDASTSIFILNQVHQTGALLILSVHMQCLVLELN